MLRDTGYSDHRCPRTLRRRGLPQVLPERRDQRKHRAAKGARGDRPPQCDRAAYRRRNVVERCINRRKQFRRVATRYDKHAVRYRACVVPAASHLWLPP